MSHYLGEKFNIKNAVFNSTGTAAVYSQTFSLRDVSRVTILCNVNEAISTVLATAIGAANFSVVCGTDCAASSMSSLTSGVLTLGQTTLGTLTNWEEVLVGADATVSTGRTLVIDGTTFTINPNSSVGDKSLLSSACSAFIHSVVSAIATHCTHLETFGMVTAGGATAKAYVGIRRKDYGPGMSAGITISVTANASSSDMHYIQGLKQQGVIEFRPGDILATNASYTHFAVRLNSTVTAGMNLSAQVIRETGFQSTNVNRKKVP